MGDVLSLIEKKKKEYDEKKAKSLQRKLKKNDLDMNDFLDQLKQIRKMGGIEEIMNMLPIKGGKFKAMMMDEKELTGIEAIIQSMTKEERANYTILNGSRRKRIARGSGRSVQDVNRLIKQFQQMKKLLKIVNKSKGKGMGALMGAFSGGMRGFGGFR